MFNSRLSMRTLFLVKDFPPDVGGVQGLLGQLARRWPGEVRVIASRTPGDVEHDRAYPADVTRVSSFKSLPGFLAVLLRQAAFFFAVANLWRRWRFDRIICGYLQFSGPIALFWNRFLGVPFVVLTYGMELLRLRRSRAPGLWRGLLRRAQLVTTIAEPFQEFLKKFAPKARARKIPMACIISRHADEPLPEPYRGHSLAGKRVILSVGRLVARKGFDTLIAAMPMLIANDKDIACIIVGKGDDGPRLESLARESGVADKVIFTGEIGETELAQLYERADVFAMISRQEGDNVEGFGIVFIEAGARGTPVVGGRSGGVAEAVKDNISGLLADPTSAKDVAEKISAILDDPEMAARMGEEGRRIAREVHTFENMLATLTKELDI